MKFCGGVKSGPRTNQSYFGANAWLPNFDLDYIDTKCILLDKWQRHSEVYSIPAFHSIFEFFKIKFHKINLFKNIKNMLVLKTLLDGTAESICEAG